MVSDFELKPRDPRLFGELHPCGQIQIVGERELILPCKHLVRDIAEVLWATAASLSEQRIRPTGGSREEESNAHGRSAGTSSSGRHRRA